MKKSKVRTFQSRLREDMKDPEFKAHYKEERQALMLAMKIAKLREKKSLSQLHLQTSWAPASRLSRGLKAASTRGLLSRPLKRLPK